VVFSAAALDCGFDNPVFATIELDYSEVDQVGRRGLRLRGLLLPSWFAGRVQVWGASRV
jgi:hypothetical protein